jgi:hypothetical protein
MSMNDDKPVGWPMEHFSQGNPYGPGMDDVPALLRRVADTIEDLGAVSVSDLVMHTEITGEGYWPSLIVYFSRNPEDVEQRKWSPIKTSED